MVRIHREYGNKNYDPETVEKWPSTGRLLRVSKHGTGADICDAVIFILNEVRDMINEAQNDR